MSLLTRHTAPFTQDILAHLHKAYWPIYTRHCPFYKGHSGPFTQGNIVQFTRGILSHLHKAYWPIQVPGPYIEYPYHVHLTNGREAQHQIHNGCDKLNQPQQHRVQWKGNDQPASRQSVPRHICSLVITISRYRRKSFIIIMSNQKFGPKTQQKEQERGGGGGWGCSRSSIDDRTKSDLQGQSCMHQRVRHKVCAMVKVMQ